MVWFGFLIGFVLFGLVWFGFLIGFERGSAKLRLACGPCRGRTLAKTNRGGVKQSKNRDPKKGAFKGSVLSVLFFSY